MVPAGQFRMGAAVLEASKAGAPPEIDEAERPRHEVTLSQPIAIGRFEVSHAHYRAYAEATDRPNGDRCFVWDDTTSNWENKLGHSWLNPGFAPLDVHPVVCVNWHDATAYTQWLSNRTGHPYRLLSEAEWEYAARAQTDTRWFFGNRTSLACGFANVNDHRRGALIDRHDDGNPGAVFDCTDGYSIVSQRSQFKPNAFGLYDMTGNVWEWVEDCFNSTYEGAPLDGSAWLSGDCSQRMNRGGSYADPPWRTRSAMREWDPADGRYAQHGFRVARDLQRRYRTPSVKTDSQ